MRCCYHDNMCHKNVDMKYMQVNVLKSVTKIAKTDGGVKLTRLIGHVE